MAEVVDISGQHFDEERRNKRRTKRTVEEKNWGIGQQEGSGLSYKGYRVVGNRRKRAKKRKPKTKG